MHISNVRITNYGMFILERLLRKFRNVEFAFWSSNLCVGQDSMTSHLNLDCKKLLSFNNSSSIDCELLFLFTASLDPAMRIMDDGFFLTSGIA